MISQGHSYTKFEHVMLRTNKQVNKQTDSNIHRRRLTDFATRVSKA